MDGKIKLGVSIYPDFMTISQMEERLVNAKKLGYSIIFTSIQLQDLGFENTQEEIGDNFRYLFDRASELGLECHVDINDVMLEKIGASIHDLNAVKELNIPVIRIDGGFNADELAVLTNNKEGIIIEENLSNYKQLKKNYATVEAKGNMKQYCGCHNFFPLNGTGISMEEAIEVAKEFKRNGNKTGIFIASQYSAPDLNAVGHGVPTVEKHRYLPSYVQVQEIIASKAFDYVIFGDSDPSYQELLEVAKHNNLVQDVLKQAQDDQEILNIQDMPCIDIPCYFEKIGEDNIKKLESMVLLARDDKAQKMIRATQTRGKFYFLPNMNIACEKYMIMMQNGEANRYSGEIHIMLDELPPARYTNCIGYVKPYAQCLLKYVHDGKVAFRLVNE
ncbi:MAG: MupG family TIM beta-alpha barrel fold protein [Erysipelotrichaceae bacterium]|nr:MupG family TIM beta-alpha barrel fold protein [Erysipelotrichaceae bacterium]MDY5252754.1 MupG family TIM beta-alpha barrel fold protein [Erysipelotrichaceae bacterium]